MKKLILALITLCSISCTESDAQEPKLYKASINNVSFQCRSIGAIESCGARLYDCTDGSFARFDVICATNVTVQR